MNGVLKIVINMELKSTAKTTAQPASEQQRCEGLLNKNSMVSYH